MSDLLRRPRRIVAAASLLVPKRRRRSWVRQWEAELAYRLRVAGPAGLTRFALGALAHALYLRREEGRMTGYLGDLAHSVRSLVRRPGFTLLVCLTLATGIGSATAVFSLAEAVLLRPAPFDQGEQLVHVFSSDPSRGMDAFSVSYPDYRDFASRDDLFQGASFYMRTDRDLSGAGDPVRLRTVAAHWVLFDVLRMRPLLGRSFTAEDGDPRAEATVLLSEGLWVRSFGADPGAVGRTVRLDGVPYTVVGVVPATQAWPPDADAWYPLQWGASVPHFADARSNHTWQVVARLRPGVAAETASTQLQEMARALYADASDERERGIEAMAVPLRRSAAGGADASILVVMGGAVLLVLLLACLNASGLLLAHTSGRARELSLRGALGAGRARLVALLLGEAGVLALVGGGLGVALAFVGLRQALALAPPGLTTLSDARVNPPVLIAALLISVVAAVLAGLAPALCGARASVAETLKQGGHGSGEAGAVGRARRALVVAELTLSTVLVLAAGMLVGGLQRQLASDPGFDAERLLTFSVRLPATRYGDPALVEQYYEEAVARLVALPGVVSASRTSTLPLGGGGLSLYRGFLFDGDAPPPEGAVAHAAWVEVDPVWFTTLGVRPVQGRAFTRDDDARAPLVAMVNESMARSMSPERSMVDRSVRSHYDENVPRTVVGVLPDIQFDGLTGRAEPAVFVPASQSVRRAMTFLVRAAGDEGALIPAVRRAMAELDGDVALDRLRTLGEAHREDLAGARFVTLLFGAFGALALVLAVSGVYGVVAHSVAGRTHEIGIRMAIGATAPGVQLRVVSDSVRLAAVGIGLGLLLALGVARVLTAVLFGLPRLDPSTLAAAAAVLGGSALLASWLPSRRVTRVDPVEALRRE